MTPTLRQLESGHHDPELLLLGTTGATMLIGVAWIGARLPYPRCVFHALTGLPCPTCGATRCVAALLHGQITSAIAWNPLIFSALVVLALLNLYAAATLLAPLPPLRPVISMERKRPLAAALSLLVLTNWAYLIHHGV